MDQIWFCNMLIFSHITCILSYVTTVLIESDASKQNVDIRKDTSIWPEPEFDT